VNEQLDFDAVTGRPTRLRVQAPDHTMLRDQTFTFDDVGNLHQIDSPLPVEAGVFTYDDLDRLTDATYGSGEHFAYQYTDGGRIQRIDGVGDFTYDGLQGSGAVTHAGPNSYTYSADGHLRTAPYGTLEFDAFDNLTGVDLTAGGRLECVYDFRGQRVVRQVVGGRQSIYADPNIEFHNGQALEWVSFAGRRVLAIVGGAGLFLHYDLLATPTLYTAGDGTVARRLAFGPYGTLRSEAGAGTDPPDAERLAGQPFDPETGLVCFGRRFYDPRLGRFISADRAVGGIYRPDAWDRYAYGHNNPLRFSDPTGRLSGWDILAIIGIVVVVAVLVVLGIFTYGATWAVAGAVINVGGLLIGTAAGVAAGAVLGGIAAARAGQDVWKGVLFGGFIGGVAAFAGGILGPIAGHLAGSVWSSLYFSMAVGGAVQGAVVGAGTGAAVGFAGGAGTAESIWTNIWKGAAIGAVTGALLGLVSAYIQQNPYLQLGLPAKSNPAVAASGDLVDRASYLDSATSFGQGVARGFTGAGHSFGLGSFVGFGAAPVNTALNVSVSWLPTVIMQYGVITAASSTFVGLDKFNIVEFGDVLVFVLEVAPFFIGVFFTVADDAKWDWFKDMKSGLETAFDVGQ
jgi:RHS repeat-associated protein